jgi:hypothetical protein
MISHRVLLSPTKFVNILFLPHPGISGNLFARRLLQCHGSGYKQIVITGWTALIGWTQVRKQFQKRHDNLDWSVKPFRNRGQLEHPDESGSDKRFAASCMRPGFYVEISPKYAF